MPYGTVNADVIQSSVSGVSLGAGNATVFKNRIINGDMRIDQRNAGASVSIQTNTFYTLDRWTTSAAANSKYSVQQNAGSVTPPAGFINYLGVTSSAATTPGATDSYDIRQKIEGLNISDLAWGTANAKTVTLSFWVYSSLTGTFGGCLGNSAFNRSYPFTYTISSANTWTQISITIAGDTTGTWLTTNGVGIIIYFGLGVGSSLSGAAGAWSASGYTSATGATNVVGTNGATFYITGVQLEVGSSATGFEYRSFGTELALCQRYFETNITYGTALGNNVVAADRAVGTVFNSTNMGLNYKFAVPKRVVPTMTFYSSVNNPAVNGQGCYFSGVWNQFSSSGLSGENTVHEIAITCTIGATTSWTSYLVAIPFGASSEL